MKSGDSLRSQKEIPPSGNQFRIIALLFNSAEKEMYRFLVGIEKANGNYSPDLPGCVATGATHEEVERNMHEVTQMHVGGLLEDNLPVPESRSFAEYIAVEKRS